ncbi:MAG: mechanosensitive ion channel [Methanomicrobia archaeon]|nr:mechanosensitive ion channel [Methanomicrobia archaeon]MCK4636761.1 mechanosensitive ion channel [Methanomicrobia archaeon]
MSQIDDLLVRAWENVKEYFPNIVACVVILIMGYIVGRLAQKAIDLILKQTGMRRYLERVEEREGRDIGISISSFIGVIVKWIIYLVAIMSAISVLGVSGLNEIMAQLVTYLPNIIFALVIVILGIVIGDKAAGFVRYTCEELKVPKYWIMGNMIRYLIYAIVIVIALAQLKISTDVLIIGIAVVLAALGVTLILALKEIAPNMAAGFHLIHDTPFKIGDIVEIDGNEGVVDNIGLISTTIKAKEEKIIIPNSKFLENVVKKKL